MTIEATRHELPCKEGHRGRKPCEWRIGDFVIPKKLTCQECENDKITNKDSFISLLGKMNLSPEELVNQYVCRSCRAGTKANDETDKISELDETKEDVVQGRFETKVRNSFAMCGLQIGMIVNRKPVVFFAHQSEFEDKGLAPRAWNDASEIYELTKHQCFRHPVKDVTAYQLSDGFNKFSNVQKMYVFEDMNKILKLMSSGEEIN